jgi:hypothetical protein
MTRRPFSEHRGNTYPKCLLVSLTIRHPKVYYYGKAMNRKPLTRYFSGGFSLANRSLDILCVTILLLLPSIVSTYLPATNLRGIIALITALFTLISIVFGLSIPVFLVARQQGGTLSYKEVFGVVARNTRRMILPVIVYFLVFGALLFLSIILSAGRALAFFQNMSELSKGWQPTSVIFISVVSLFTFTPFFFSLENNGFFTSMKKGLRIALHNTPYIALVILFGVASYSITSIIPKEVFWGRLLTIAVGQYGNLVLIATSLFYYQDAVKEEPIVKTSRGRSVHPSQ